MSEAPFRQQEEETSSVQEDRKVLFLVLVLVLSDVTVNVCT